MANSICVESDVIQFVFLRVQYKFLGLFQVRELSYYGITIPENLTKLIGSIYCQLNIFILFKSTN